MKRKRGVLSLWATLALVLVAFVAVAGATVLALFLMGRFSNNGVAPGDDLTFVMTGGLGHTGEVDEDGGPVFYISEDSFFQVQTGVADVTEKDLRLYFDTSLQEDVVSRPGYITDGIIIVKERAKIGERIEVTLAPDVDHEGFPKGGVSTLYVGSPTNPDSVTDRHCKIVVDVPVEKSGFSVSINGQTGNEQTVVVSVPSFEIVPTFTPQKSGYYFADGNKPRLVFFDILSQKIIQEPGFAYNEFKPTAVTGGTPEVVRFYTFKNSEYQRQFLTEKELTENAERDILNEAFQDYRFEHGDQVVFNDVNISIQGVSVTGVKVEPSTALALRLDKNFRLTTKRPSAGQVDFGTLNVTIQQGNEAATQYVNALYANLGIKIPTVEKDGVWQILPGFKISGGNVIEVDKTTWIVSKPREMTFDDINAILKGGDGENKMFYCLPYTRNIVSSDDYYWNVSSETTLAQESLSVNFFEEKAGGWQAFFKFDGETETKKDAEQTFTLSASLPTQKEPEWKDSNAISLTITASTSSDEGNSARVNLPSLMKEIDKDNVYRTIRYFLIKPTGDTEKVNDFDPTVYFDQIDLGKTYTKYYTDADGNEGADISISGVPVTPNGYTLYEFVGNYLIAKKELPLGLEFNIVALLVRTDAAGNVVRDDKGCYQVINNSPGKLITVDSTLSVENMNPMFEIADETFGKRINDKGVEDSAGDYYIPSMIRDAEVPSQQRDILKFRLVLSNVTEIPPKEDDKILTAFTNGKASLEENGMPWLTVVAMDQNRTKDLDCIELISLARTEPTLDAHELEYTGTFSINETKFAALTDGIDSGTYIVLELRYYDGREVLTKNITDEEGVNHFYVYYQQPQSIEFNNPGTLYETQNPYVSVEVDAGKLTITWGKQEGGNPQTVATVADLQKLISFTLLDRFGRTIEPQLGYKLRLDEMAREDGEVTNLLSFNEDRTNIGQTFRATSLVGETTTLVARVVDASGNYQTKNGTAEGEQIKCATEIKFFVKSVGLKTIKRDVSTGAGNDLQPYDDLQSVLAASMVEVSKYVTKDTELTFSNLVEFYTSSDENTPVQNIKVGLSAPFYNNLLEKQKEDLGKMLSFDGGDKTFGLLSNITSIKFNQPFGEDTFIDFIVTDDGANLFSITLRLHILSNITMTPSFDTYASKEQIPARYLVRSKDYVNASPVFAGAELLFKDYMPLSTKTGGLNATYSWANEDCILTNVQGVESYKVDVEPGIKVGVQYTFGRAEFTIYYGVESQYALHQTITLYVNPDILVVKYLTKANENPYVNLEGYFGGNEETGKVFGIYRLTDYIEKGTLGEELELDYSLTYIGEDGSQFIAMSDGKYVFVGNKDIDLYYGQKLTQEFGFTITGTSETSSTLAGATVTMIGKELGEVVLDEEESPIQIAIDFGIDQRKDTSVVFHWDGNGEPPKDDEKEYAPVVKYNKGGEFQTYVMIERNHDGFNGFYAVSGYKLISAQGILRVQGRDNLAHLIIAGNPPFLSVDGNSFVVTRTFTDSKSGTLTVSLTVNAIVTGMGKDNVYYANDGKNFNSFTNEDGKEITYDVLMGDWKGLEKEKVYQPLTAGEEYTIIHDLYDTKESGTPEPGFYYNSFDDNIPVYLTIIKAVANGVEQEITDDGKKTNLATIKNDNKLQINHLESSYNQTYLILQLTLQETGLNGRKFTWYYRIKIKPSFTVGQPTYPYGENGEYLDKYSSYYNEEAGQYEIDLSETFTYSNSGRQGGKRFGDIKVINEKPVGATPQYEIASAYLSKEANVALDPEKFNESFEFKVENELLTIKVKTEQPLTIYLRQYYTLDEMRLLGSEQSYILRFNQMSGFNHSLSYNPTNQVDGSESKPLSAKGNVYEAELVQDNTGLFTPDIQKQEAADRVSNYLDFKVYVKGDENELKAALKPYVTVEAGTVYTIEGEEGNKTFVATTSFFASSIEQDKATGNWKVVDDENGSKYVFTAEQFKNVSYNAYVKIENNNDGTRKLLTFKAQSEIKQDYKFEVGVFSNEQVIFTINLKVTSVYKYTPNAEFEGGKTYGFTGESGIIKAITKNGGALPENEKLEFVLLNGSEPASFGNDNITLEDLIDNKTEEQVTFAELLADVEIKFNVSVVLVENKGEETIKTVKFTFPLTITVKKSVNINSQFTDDRREFSGYEFNVGLKTKLNNAPDKSTKSIAEIFGFGEDNVAEIKDEGKNGYALMSGNNSPVETISITPAEASSDNIRRTQQMTIGYYFNNKLIFDYEFTFIYFVNPSVTLTPNYPDPDGITTNGTLGTEYIGTGEVADGYQSTPTNAFFTTSALFAGDNRIVQGWTDLFMTRWTKDHTPTADDGQDDEGEHSIEDDVVLSYTISIATIDKGLTVYANGRAYPNEGNSTLLQNESIIVVDTLTLIFKLDKEVTSAKVTFNIEVNGVSTEYVVTVIQGDVIKLVQTPTNYSAYDGANQAETIYVEDLNKYLNDEGDTKLFAQKRLVTYKLRGNQVGNTLYARYVENESNQAVVIQLDTSTEEKIYFDMGRSLAGMHFDAIYGQNTNGTVSDKKDNNVVFDTENDGFIRETSRLTAYYYETEIMTKLTDTSIVRRKKTEDGYEKWQSISGKYGTEDANDIVITKDENYEMSFVDTSFEGQREGFAKLGYDITNHVVRYSFAIEYNNTYFSPIEYSIRVTTELLVTGNANTIEIKTDSKGNTINPLNGLRIQEIEAGTSQNLMSMSAFGFTNARTGKAIAQINASARIGLQIYGFAECQIDESDPLRKSAYVLHDYLTSRDHFIDGIWYETGLLPRHGMNLNTNAAEDGAGEFGSAGDNYMMYYGDNEKDYTIKAQHCSNDGNYVMIRMKYIVNWEDAVVEQENNLLFKVVPGSNMTVQIKESVNSTTYSSSGLVNEIRDGRTYRSNANDPYIFAMGADNQDFYLVNDITTTNPTEMPTIKVIKGSDSDYGAKDFTFTYTPTNGEYNNFKKFADNLPHISDVAGSPQNWQNIDDSYKIKAPNVAKTVKAIAPSVNLGTKKMYITFEDDYGYKGIFYFNIQTTGIEPAFAENSTLELTEGEQLTFSVAYQNVTVAGNENEENKWVTYQAFDGYLRDKNKLTLQRDTGFYTNPLQPILQINGIRMIATVDNQVYTKIALPDGDSEAGGESGTQNNFGGNIVGANFSTLTPYNMIDIEIWKSNDQTKEGDERGQGVDLDMGWKLHQEKVEEPGLTQEQLEKASIVFEFRYKKHTQNKSEEDETQVPGDIPSYTTLYTATYNGKPLIQTHTIGETHIPTKDELGIVGDNADKITPIAITGIGAYAYTNALGTLDKTSVINAQTASKFLGNGEEFTVNDKKYYEGEITVESIKFVLKSDENTSVASSESITPQGGETTLLADPSKFFVASNNGTLKLIQGKGFGDEEKDQEGGITKEGTQTFTVPDVKGYLYDLADRVSGVEMLVTLTTNNTIETDRETQVLKRDVTIKKKNAREPFENFNVLDGDTVSAQNSDITLYNNTLEVVVAPNTKGTVTISAGTEETTFDISNEANFAVTKYLRILGNKNDYPWTNDNITTVQFKAKTEVNKGWVIKLQYNGTEIQSETETDIELYPKPDTVNNAITLRINDPSELGGNIKEKANKTEKLYFLYNNSYSSTEETGSNNSELYRQEPDFKVYPQISTLEGTATKTIDKYLRVSETNKSPYYVIPFQSWAENVTVKDFKDNASEQKLKDLNAYQFYFDINAHAIEGGSAGGAAYIDERGTITTTTSFNPTNDGIAVNVYVNVSGNDGMYENDISKMENKEKVYLGTVDLALKHFSDEGFSSVGETSSGVYNMDGVAKEQFVAQYGNIEATWMAPTIALAPNPDEKIKGTFTAAVGEKVDLRNMFGNISIGITNNKHYHLVKIQAGTQEESYVPYNNVDYYTFTNAGSYTLTILATGRNVQKEPTTSITPTEKLFKVTMIVYSSGESALKYTKVVKDGSDFSLSTLDSKQFGDDKTTKWYILDKTTNSMKDVGENYTISTAEKFDNLMINSDRFTYGRNERSFLAQTTEGSTVTTKLVDVVFWVYNNSAKANTSALENDTQNSESDETFGIQLRTKRVSTNRADYRLSNLFAPQTTQDANYSYSVYTFEKEGIYDKVGGTSERQIENQSLSSEAFGDIAKKTYVVVENRRVITGTTTRETITNCFVYRVEFLINQNTQTSVQTVKRSSRVVADKTEEYVSKNDILSTLKSVFQHKEGAAQYYLRDEATGELKNIQDETGLNSYTFTRQYVKVTTGADGKTSFEQIQILFYIYDDADGSGEGKTNDTPTINIHTSQTTRYYLSNLDAFVKNEAAYALAGATDLTISYYEMGQDNTPMSQPTPYIPLTGNDTRRFYIIVNGRLNGSNKSYYFDMTFNFEVEEGIADTALIDVKKEHPNPSDESLDPNIKADVIKTDEILTNIKTALKVTTGADEVQLFSNNNAITFFDDTTNKYIELSETDLKNGFIEGLYGIRYTKDGKANYAFTNIKMYFHDVKDLLFPLNFTIGLQKADNRTFEMKELVQTITGIEDLNITPSATTHYEFFSYREVVGSGAQFSKIEDIEQMTVGFGETSRTILVGVRKTATTEGEEGAPKVEITYNYYELTLNFTVPLSANRSDPIEITNDATATSAFKDKLVEDGVITAEQKEKVTVVFKSVTNVTEPTTSGLQKIGEAVSDDGIVGDTIYLAYVTIQDGEEETTTVYKVSFIMGE